MFIIAYANVYPIPVTRTDRYKNSIVPWGLRTFNLEQYLLTVVVVLLYACVVLCIMYMTIQPTRLPIN